MSPRRFARLPVLLLPGALAVCAPAPEKPAATPESRSAGPVKLDERDHGRTVALKTGETLEVNLAGNPTTGYRWETVKTEEAMLKPAGEPEHTPDSGLIGAGGRTTFRVTAAAPGRTGLTLVYRRSWEEKVEPAKTYQVTVVVK